MRESTHPTRKVVTGRVSGSAEAGRGEQQGREEMVRMTGQVEEEDLGV